MRMVREPLSVRADRAAGRLCAAAPKSALSRMVFGGVMAALLSGLVAAYNVSAGPLRNLNDIGGWDNRLLFILMTAAVQGLLLLAAAFVHRGGYARLALRQVILTAGFVIMLLPINQKTLAFTGQTLPLIRDMDAQGLAAIAGMQTNQSSAAMTLLYLITRGPVYDMYMVKLACCAAMCALGLAVLVAGERMRLGVRADALFALSLILPQGFMSAACAAQTGVIAAALMAVSLLLLTGERPRLWAGALCYGAAAAVCGAALYALPVYAALMLRGRLKARHMLAALCLMLLAQIPAIIAGQSAAAALLSPLRALFGAPQYASGVPNIMSIFPRAAMEEMPEYFLISHLPAVDPVTNFSPFFTQANIEIVMRGFAVLGLAIYAMVWMMTLRSRMDDTGRAFTLTLAAMLVCPGADAGMWLLLSAFALLAIFVQPKLRLAACVTLFAMAGAAAYPVTGEVLLPMIAAMGLCLLALFMLLGMFPAEEEDCE